MLLKKTLTNSKDVLPPIKTSAIGINAEILINSRAEDISNK